jgi:hypothetical protein
MKVDQYLVQPPFEPAPVAGPNDCNHGPVGTFCNGNEARGW